MLGVPWLPFEDYRALPWLEDEREVYHKIAFNVYLIVYNLNPIASLDVMSFLFFILTSDQDGVLRIHSKLSVPNLMRGYYALLLSTGK